MNEFGKMVVVPKHDPIKIGMITAILEQAEISKRRFSKKSLTH
jgi:predicted RNA binding protein YcfA (HicA-like mRNA interferase family)